MKVTCSTVPHVKNHVMLTVLLKMGTRVAIVIGLGTVGRTVLLEHMGIDVRMHALLMQHVLTARVIGRMGIVVPATR